VTDQLDLFADLVGTDPEADPLFADLVERAESELRPKRPSGIPLGPRSSGRA
jgi:hypothetical protein